MGGLTWLDSVWLESRRWSHLVVDHSTTSKPTMSRDAYGDCRDLSEGRMVRLCPELVNELLKAMVCVRKSPGRLIVRATNSIAGLDPALVRPGRFDLVAPIGPPDAEARLALPRDMLGVE